MSHTVRIQIPYDKPERFEELVWASGGGEELWQLLDEDGEVVEEYKFIDGRPVDSSPKRASSEGGDDA